MLLSLRPGDQEADGRAREGPATGLQTNCSEVTWQEGGVPAEVVRTMADSGLCAIGKEAQEQGQCRWG